MTYDTDISEDWEFEDIQLTKIGLPSELKLALYMVYLVEAYQKKYKEFNYTNFRTELVTAFIAGKKASLERGGITYKE